jgi:GT2 family glycosyltransferase
MADVSVVTVTWNSGPVLAACLDSVLGQETAGKLDVIAVDNASTDETVSRLEGFGRRLRLIRNRRNRGYARAVNQGIRASRGETIVLLNPDAVPEPGSIRGLTEYLSVNPVVGLVGGELVNPDGSRQDSVRSFPGYRDLARRPTSPLSHFTLRLSRLGGNIYRNPIIKAGPVDSVAGAFMGIRRRTLLKTGLFDENYFMFVEDMDLCYRVWRAGWEVHYLHGVRALHHQGGSTHLRSRRMVAEHSRSMYRFMTKHRGIGPAGRFFLSVGLNLYSLTGDVGRGRVPGGGGLRGR